LQPFSFYASLIRSDLLEDEEIIQGCRKNDRRAQQELFLKYGRRMLGYCQRYSSNHDDANDLLQDGFLKIFDNISSYKGDSPLQAWMARIIINMAISKFRKAASGPKFTDMEDEDIADQPEDIQVEQHDLNTVISAMQQLPERYRLVLNMYAIDKMSHREISEQLGISEGTSKSQLSRARQLLKDSLENKTKKD
jgi:RNA polymerase sigma factor (sigma-70 family)